MKPGTPPAAWSRLQASPGLQSIGWQAAGSAATLAAALWVSWRMGLQAQGEFGLAKSWFDAAAVVASLGLPQGLLHLQYRLGVPACALRRWSKPRLLGLALLAWVAAGLLFMAGHRLAAAVAASLPFGAAHLLARSLLLPRRPDGLRLYGLATALPALLVLAGVLLAGALGARPPFDLLLLATAALAGLLSFGLARVPERPAVAWPQRELWQVSLQTGLQQALAALLAAALLSLIAREGPGVDAGTGKDALGAAALALQVYQVFVALVGYASPLLFDHLARQDRPGLAAAKGLDRAAARGLGAALLLAALVLALAWPTVQASSWLLPLLLMLPAGLAAVAARIGATALQAQGRYAELSLQGAGRLVLALLLLLAMLRAHLPAAAALAGSLLVTELATWWRCRHCLARDR